MRFQPKNPGRGASIDTGLAPPGGFVTTAMRFAVVSSAKGHSELVADLAAECRRLGKAQVVGIGRTTTADETRLLGN
jgi:hypothetical protein